jgi:hypothetical protein
MITFFACSVALLLVLGCITSKHDPSDPIMTQYRNGNTSVYSSYHTVYKAAAKHASIVTTVKAMSIQHRATASCAIGKQEYIKLCGQVRSSLHLD